MTGMLHNIAKWLHCQNCFHQSICSIMSCASSCAHSLRYPVARQCLSEMLPEALFHSMACAFHSFLPEEGLDFIVGIPASCKLRDSLHPRFRQSLPNDKGKWKALQPKSSFVQAWSMLRLVPICHLKHLILGGVFWWLFFLYFCFVLERLGFFPYGEGKKLPILQTRYFSFKGWVFLWLFVFHIAVKLEHGAIRTRACIAGCKMMKMAVKIVQLSSKVQLSSWSCIIWIWSSLHALQHKLNTREGNHYKCKHQIFEANPAIKLGLSPA